MCEDGLHDPFTDQVECARFKAERDALAQRMEEVASEIDRTLSGVEGIEDAPAMRWMRGLREALGALHSPRTSYEDIEAAKWVREYGGLDEVNRKVAESMDQADDYIALRCSLAERAGDLYEMLDKEDDELVSLLDKRLMPEGMEWPRYEDGEPVRIGSDFGYGVKLDSFEVTSILFTSEGCFLEPDYSWEVDDYALKVKQGVRVKRPTPKVLDADGAEIRVGDTVYQLPGDWCDKFPCYGYHGAEELEVFSLHADHVEGGVGCRDTRRPKGTCYPQPSQLTHRAPVLAADGRPLREGEHVYHVETGAELVVKELPKPGEYQAVVVFATPASHLTSFDPDMLTHEHLDSWERLEEDAEKDPCDYFGFDGEEPCGKCPASGKNCEQTMARDLVRRAKALAEKEG